MLELMEEEELAAIRKQQEKFEKMRNAELSEVQRLEFEAKRKFAEKQRRKKQEREFKEAQEELREKVAARSFAKGFLSDLHANVFEELEGTGHFYDPVRKEVSEWEAAVQHHQQQQQQQQPLTLSQQQQHPSSKP